MANKRIISTLPPEASKRIIGGSTQRSAHRLRLQGGTGWQYNHHPVDNLQRNNPLYWQASAPRFDAPLSSSASVLYGRQAAQRELLRELDGRSVVSFTFDFSRPIGSSNQTFNKKPRIRDLTFGSFETELDISSSTVPNLKKRISFTATKDGVGYNGESITPFSAFSSSVTDGYRSQLVAAGLGNIDLTNFHTDSVLDNGKATPMQGPFTERFVGGVQARHVAPFRTMDRPEAFDLTISSGGGSITTITTKAHTAKGQYLRDSGAKAPVNIKNIRSLFTSDSVSIVGNYTRNYEVILGNDRSEANLDFAYNTANYAYSAPSAFVTPPAMLALGVTGSADYPAPRQISGRKISHSIIAGTFAAPGSKQDSKQLFRDVRSNQFSPNNALPYRNIVVRQPFIDNLRTHVTRGGYISNKPGVPARIKTPNNQTQRIEILATSPTATFHTGNFYDTAYMSRPLPAGDSTQWFMDLSGSDTTTYSNYVLSGSRYPENIYIQKTTLPPFTPQQAATFASTTLTFVATNEANADGKALVLIDNNGSGARTVSFFGSAGLDLNKNSRTSAIKYNFGVADMSTTAEFMNTVTFAILSASAAGDLSILPVFAADPTSQMVQMVAGAGGNTAITGTFVSYGNITLPGGTSGFTGGAEIVPASGFVAGTSGYTYLDGNKRYIWANSPWVPWTQTRLGYKNGARYYSKNNIYQLDPEIEVGTNNGLSTPPENNSKSTFSRTFTDQANNTITSFYSRQYVEPPVTSRYKPLIHQVQTFVGTPSKGSPDKTVLSLEYAYGNSLMGFANKELNNKLLGNLNAYQGKAKRPYEVLRDQLSDTVSKAASGINQIKMFSYGESIYPREVYTYLSGTRARLTFENNFWKDDIALGTPLVIVNFFAYRLDQPINQTNAKAGNRQYNRLLCPFTNSQGVVLESAYQNVFSTLNPAYYIVSGSGTGSIWPLDSYLWSDDIKTYDSIQTGTFSTPVILADQSTLPAGELMSVNYGPVIDLNTDSTHAYNIGSSSYSRISTSTNYGLPVNAQYVYSIPFVTGSDVAGFQPEPRSPGDVYSRPNWTAGSKRRYIDGSSRGALAPTVYPFYNSYEEYAEDVRAIGAAYGIVPEFRISENISTYQTNATPFDLVSTSLEITGASKDLFDGTAAAFYSRYAMTDDIEFLNDFMSYDKSNPNYIFNKFPKHFELNSEAVVKLLPYDGFYPVNRTLQLATLYSQSYGPHGVYTDVDATGSARWRPLLRPFFAPGIMYNSIKSGIAVNYPIRRATKSSNGYQDYYSVTYASPAGGGTFVSDASKYKIGFPLKGALNQDLNLSATLYNGVLPDNSRRARPSASWESSDVNTLFWADKLPFESIIHPEDYLSARQYGLSTVAGSSSLIQGGPSGSLPTVDSDDNHFIRQDVTASFEPGADISNLYSKAVSNFLANVPQFFLKKRPNKYGSAGHLTKFVSQFGAPPKGSQTTSAAVRTVEVKANAAYMMEIGLIKTDQFNLYSNPHAFGQPTNISNLTGSWDILRDEGTAVPQGANWPNHRGEFAPFTPPYYYGPSLVRITFMPTSNGSYTLDEIVNNTKGEVFVDYLNESSSYYDVSSGSFYNREGLKVTTNRTPAYQWNRAWLNRMDIDASVTIGNEFTLGKGAKYKSSDPNKWTIMSKWECPALDFPDHIGTSTAGTPYNFSASIEPGQFKQPTVGMWHQYGIMPKDGKGIYLYIKDVPNGTSENEEYDRVLTYHKSQTGGPSYYPTGADFGVISQVRKIPSFVIESGRTVLSLADLCGFDDDEIIRKGFDPSKAKRIGELADDDESSISEAILAMPFYLDDSGTPRLINMQAQGDKLGPKIKEFRKNFTKYSLPPALAQKLVGLVPQGYPNVPNYINPFGGDDYDSVLSGEEVSQIPVIYLMEHKVAMTKQDLADVWQGIMPDFGTKIRFSLSAIDHYMPGDNLESTESQFPEILKEQISLGMVRDGHPRYDLLDIAESCKQGFAPDIKWMVFKVKQRGLSSYSEMVIEEVDGPDALSYDNVKELLSLQGLPQSQVDKVLSDRDEYAKNLYISKHSLNDPTYNWPYDYCSLIESAKLNTKVGFRPDLAEEYKEFSDSVEQTTRDEKTGKK